MEAALPVGAARGLDTTRFHFRMAIVFVVIAFGGFTPTYWARVALGTFHAPPIVHIHGTLLFSWTLLYLLQTTLVASGRTVNHRAVGLFGIALFSVMCCSIIATRLTLLRLEELHGFGARGRQFSAVALCSLPLLVGLFTLAIANIRRPEIHKRLMYLLMVGLMIPAIARVFVTLLSPAGAVGPPPVFVLIPPTLTAALLIVVAIVHDWRTRGRPHQVYVLGGLTLVLGTLAIVPFSATAAWMAIIRTLEGISG